MEPQLRGMASRCMGFYVCGCVCGISAAAHACVCVRVNISFYNTNVSLVRLDMPLHSERPLSVWRTGVVTRPKGNQLHGGRAVNIRTALALTHEWVPIYTCYWKINKQGEFPKWSFKDELAFKSLMFSFIPQSATIPVHFMYHHNSVQ